MFRRKKDVLAPWIESLIQSYGSEEGTSDRRTPRAYVTAASRMSNSEARLTEGPPDLLFLSDGVVQIPTFLTPTAVEYLRRDEIENFKNLIDCTVYVTGHRLKFHTAADPTRSKFFLSAGRIMVISVGPTKPRTPCCTTLRSVKQKIFETWRAIMVQETQDSLANPNDFNLSELLGEWQNDNVQTVLQDVQKRLMMFRLAILGVSSFNGHPTVTESDMFTPTNWDIERENDMGCFSIPIKCLLIPEGHAVHGPKESANISTTDGDMMLNLQPSPCTRSSVDPVDGQTAKLPEGAGEVQNCGDNIADPDSVCVKLTNKEITPLEKPWEMFPPPNGLSFLGMSQEAIPIPPMQSHKQNYHLSITGTQLPITSTQSEDLQHSKEAHDSFPPYKKTACSSGKCNTGTPTSPTAPEEVQSLIGNVDAQQETIGRQHRKAKRKLNVECVQEAQATVAVEEDEAQVMTSGTDEGGIHVETLCAEKRKTLTVHAGGEPFSYTYMASGQNLHDFSKFQVAKSLLAWAVKYLVPKQRTPDCTLSD
ncbi:adrenocortical dysplasia protein homolog [Hippocampus zosterae]|uniref:adrenocortical dysplasia protein homolog n=1 Tax=Hippocampus zosterae TaxID=109293 RepID=UPI00223E40F5|nr:adrenocortical dysplasia protein homolog [Hippocampus zosterae]